MKRLLHISFLIVCMCSTSDKKPSKPQSPTVTCDRLFEIIKNARQRTEDAHRKEQMQREQQEQTSTQTTDNTSEITKSCSPEQPHG